MGGGWGEPLFWIASRIGGTARMIPDLNRLLGRRGKVCVGGDEIRRPYNG